MTDGLGRDEILRRFESLLDAAWTGEAPPSGVDQGILEAIVNGPDATDPRADSYALWTSMTALTQEVKLQGRAFQELNHTLASQTGKIAEELRAVYSERERALQREAERRARREVLNALIDLRDRLGRGRELVGSQPVIPQAPPPASWWQRLFSQPAAPPPAPNEAFKALVRGYELSIERLDQTLEEFNAREIRCQGERFDPKRMNAIESEESSSAEPDTVLEVYRSGYEWNGEVFRPAQVKVSRSTGASKHE